MSGRSRRWLWPLLILLVAVLVAAVLMFTQEQPETEEAAAMEQLVETITVQAGTHRFNIEAQGTVTAARRVSVQPQVPGRLAWVHPNLEPGGVIEENEPLFRIEQADYELAVAQQEAAVTEARAQLELERGRSEVAEEEWELFEDELGPEADPGLARREPQLSAAKAQLAAAETRYEQALLDLSRTEVDAPFHALVVQEQAAVGQLVGTQAEVARLVDTAYFWLQAPLPKDRIPHIDIPGVTAQSGSVVKIEQEINGRVVARRGVVERLLGDVDAEGRMARLLIRVNDPLGLEQSDEAARGVPLLLNSFVEAIIQGPEVENVVELTRQALREDERAYIVNEDGKLSIRELEIVWRRSDTVLVQSGLSDGDRVITSPLAFAYEGMPVRLAQEGRSGDE